MQKNILFSTILLVSYFLITADCTFAAPVITLTPKEPIQGEPVLLQISGAKLSDIKKLTFGKLFFI
jgi:hypothetical protein